MSIVSSLNWHRNETPEELISLLETLGEEFPIYEGGRGPVDSSENK